MIFIVVLLVSIFLLFIFLFNKLTRYKFLMQEAWSGIDVQLKRRHDLIPNVISAVKGYKEYESKVLESVTSLRSQLDQPSDIKEKAILENNLSKGLKTIFALAENYPDLKANQSFLELQKTLIDIEDQIQMARRYYNGCVRNFNIAVETIPGNVVAGIFNFKPASFFDIEYATERKVPDVKF